MDKQAAAPKRFGQTAAAKVDPHKQRVPLSTYAGEEVLVRAFHMARSEFGEYAILTIQRHGAPSEEVSCSAEKIVEQLLALEPGDMPVIAWVHQAKSLNGKTGRLWFSDVPPENTYG